MRVAIRAIAVGGDGVGALGSGKTVFVPRTAPGDVVDVEIVEERKRYAKARVLRLVESGPDRTDPLCPHYAGDDCGGCQLQHLTYAAQLEAKRRMVGDALRRIGRVASADPPIVPAPAEWRYRSRVVLASRGSMVGFHQAHAPGRVFDMRDCHLASGRLMDLWRGVTPHRGLLPPDVVSITLREDRQDGLHAVIETRTGRSWDAEPLARAVGAEGVTYWHRVAGGDPTVVAGERSDVPVLAFEQVQSAFGDRIRQDAVASLGTVHGFVVWDLYAGLGEGARRLADRGAERVCAVERDPSAVDWGEQATGSDPHAKVVWWRGTVEEHLASLPEPDAVLVNPPRSGLAVHVAGWLDQWGRRRDRGRIAYVSCDPATLARDIGRLSAFEAVDVRAYDLFPQTAHVETLVLLEAA